MVYHYTDSGLDNIYLENGYVHHKTPYGEGVSIQNTEGLHKEIGKWLVSLPKPLNGAELRFLRLEMEQTQRHLAAVLNAQEQTLRLWEKSQDESYPRISHRLLRALYLDYIGGDGHICRCLNAWPKWINSNTLKGRFKTPRTTFGSKGSPPLSKRQPTPNKKPGQ